jgi:hypothetical protein
MSKIFTLSSIDWKKIGVGALVAITGAVLTYLTPIITNLELGQWTPIVVAVWSVIANVVRKWITETK